MLNKVVKESGGFFYGWSILPAELSICVVSFEYHWWWLVFLVLKEGREYFLPSSFTEMLSIGYVAVPIIMLSFIEG